ncbi:class I adenylate-forming enzyme family protein [Novosphingobium sp.]|uniref:class I adenylate-forming enzyme family protein n=1 Tax=Novosphingobium sp. TaxID=1874826 RepID=UPI00352AA775
MTNHPARAELTLGRGIRNANARSTNKTALIFENRSLTYSQLVSRINKTANIAAGLGLRFGDTVAVLSPNCLEYVELVAGLSDLGIIVATLNPRLTRPELERILDDCRPKAIVCHPSTRHLVSDERARDLKLFELGTQWDDLLAQASDSFVPGYVPEDHTFSISYTSGTTGMPKGVMLSHRGRGLAFLIMQAEYNCFGYRDHFLALSPQYHGAGFAFCYAPLVFGGTTTLLGHYDPEFMISRIGQGDIDGVFMVPTHFHRIFDLPQATLDKWKGTHRLRTIISNAAALPQTTKEQIIDYFGEDLLNESYGSTEVGFVCNIRPEDHLRKPHSVGVPFYGIEVELRDENGEPVPNGTPGELFARGPTTFNGYLNRPEETAEAVKEGGWVTVGDMAIRDDDGFHYIVDRKKDMVVSGGVNVYPREIENVVARVEGVAEVAVVGRPDREWGEALHAFIVPFTGAEVDADLVIKACRTELSGYKVPRGISFIGELPRNASGKIMKRELRDMLIAEARGS